MSNSASWNGVEPLFFLTLALMRLPIDLAALLEGLDAGQVQVDLEMVRHLPAG